MKAERNRKRERERKIGREIGREKQEIKKKEKFGLCKNYKSVNPYITNKNCLDIFF